MPDSDGNNAAGGGAWRDAIGDDGQPGIAVDGYPGVRAGALVTGSGLLGVRYLHSRPAPSPLVYDPTAKGCPAGFTTRNMEVTGYTSGPESTGKRPGDYGYNIGKYGPVGPGSIAAPRPAFGQGTNIYVPGYGLGTVRDTGGAIKGDRLDLWFPTVAQARDWGRKKLNVEICDPK